MKTLKRSALAIITLFALSFVAVGCTTTGSTDNDMVFKRVSGETHRAAHPDGHAPQKGRSCHYDQGEDVFFCSFAE